jgi:hypothetical protein
MTTLRDALKGLIEELRNLKLAESSSFDGQLACASRRFQAADDADRIEAALQTSAEPSAVSPGVIGGALDEVAESVRAEYVGRNPAEPSDKADIEAEMCQPYCPKHSPRGITCGCDLDVAPRESVRELQARLEEAKLRSHDDHCSRYGAGYLGSRDVVDPPCDCERGCRIAELEEDIARAASGSVDEERKP